MEKTIITMIMFIIIFACSNPYKEELYKTGKSSAAQGRIGSSQSGADSIFKDLD